jgi:hypothetical protein
MSTTVETATAIRPFHVEFPEEQIDDLRRRVAATRWASKELVSDRSQGVQLDVMRELARYWLDVGSGSAAELATYFVEKDRPFLVVVD